MLKIGLVLLVCICAVTSAHAQSPGKFVGTLEVSLDPDGRTLTLLKDYEFDDPAGLKWLAPKGSRVDGASIPRAFWSVIGGPLEGRYRNASVIHDVYSDNRQKSWQATHRVFYDGMLASDVGPTLAKTMYYAVYAFGPRWTVTNAVHIERQCEGAVCANVTKQFSTIFKSVAVDRQSNDEKLKAFQRALEARPDIDLAEIERLADQDRGQENTETILENKVLPIR